MDGAAIDRIHNRLAQARGGTASAAGAMRWKVALPEDEGAAPTIAFHNQLVFEGGRLTSIDCDARLDRCTAAQAGVVASFQAALATALRREGVAFASFADVARFLAAELRADVQVNEGTVQIAPGVGEGPCDHEPQPVFVSDVCVVGEPWVSFATPFLDDVDPAWMLEQNGLLTHLHFEAFEGEVSLATAMPLAGLTGQRVIDLVEDLLSFRDSLLDDLAEEDEDGGDPDAG